MTGNVAQRAGRRKRRGVKRMDSIGEERNRGEWRGGEDRRMGKKRGEELGSRRRERRKEKRRGGKEKNRESRELKNGTIKNPPKNSQ